MIGWQVGYWSGQKLETRGNWKLAANIYQRLWDTGEAANSRVNFRLGHAYFRLDKLELAEEYLRRALSLDPYQPNWHYRLGFIKERLGRWPDALESYTAALANNPQQAEWHYRRAKCEEAVGDKVAAQASLRSALKLEPNEARYHRALGKLLSRGAARWQEIEALEDGLFLHSDDPEWLNRLALSYFEMNRFSEAESLYVRALKVSPDDALLWFNLGLAQDAGRGPLYAQSSYSRAVAADKVLGASQFGVGVFFEAKRNWPRAAESYKDHLQHSPLDPGLHYRLGFARDRAYHWKDAIDSYQNALALRPLEAYWRYRLGFAYERSEQLDSAIEAYSVAVRISNGKKPYWLFRLAYVLELSGNFEEACGFYIQASSLQPLDQISVDISANGATDVMANLRGLVEQSARSVSGVRNASQYFEIGRNAEKLGDWELAADMYERAVLRSDDHKSSWFNRLGYVLHRAERADEACQAFRKSRIFARPYGISEQTYSKTPAVKAVIEYVEYYETLPIEDRHVLYESNLGSSIDCNPLSIFEGIVDDPEYADFTHVWTVSSSDTLIPVSLLGRSNVVVVLKQSDLYRRFLATARYLINNSTFPSYFIRRTDQSYLNTWHGTPLKKMGTDVEGAVLDHANVTRNLLHTTHLLSPNAHTTDVLTRAFGVDEIFGGQVALTGYPRIDKTLDMSSSQRAEILNQLGIDANDQRPIVLYAPTWRGSMNAKVLDTESMVADIEALASAEDFHLLVRAHHYTEDLLLSGDVKGIVVPRSLTTNTLLSVVDVLVTDYSSVLFDFMATGRPIIFYVPDMDEYIEERGLYFPLDSLPGALCQHTGEVVNAIRDEIENGTVNPRYKASQEVFTPLEDGSATQKVIAFFFEGEARNVVSLPSKKSSLLFRHGMNPNGMTASLQNLLHVIDDAEYSLTLLIDAGSLPKEQQRLSAYRRLPANVRVVGRIGRHAATVEEKWIVGNFTKFHSLPSAEQWDLYMASFRREFRRIFGPTCFDSLIEFDGYSPFMASILLGGANGDNQKQVWLHNDMMAEHLAKYPYLRAMFRLYDGFDSVVSVSEALSGVNSEKLSSAFRISSDKFDHSPNLIVPNQIKSMGEQVPEAPVLEWIADRDKVFAISARLSPEKDHEKLLRAFALLAVERPFAGLLIVGEGILGDDLRRLAISLGLEKSVYFAGMQENPFSILSRCDCFILSSNHEGQPMVLLEAMVLGMPIVATDIAGSRGVLSSGKGDRGLLVANSVEGLLDGMTEFLSGKVRAAPFDADQYVLDAVAKFEDVVGANRS